MGKIQIMNRQLQEMCSERLESYLKRHNLSQFRPPTFLEYYDSRTSLMYTIQSNRQDEDILMNNLFLKLKRQESNSFEQAQIDPTRGGTSQTRYQVNFSGVPSI